MTKNISDFLQKHCLCRRKKWRTLEKIYCSRPIDRYLPEWKNERVHVKIPAQLSYVEKQRDNAGKIGIAG